MQTIAAREISLYELEQRFGLQAIDREFIAALTETAVPLTPEEQKTLDRIRHNYQNLLRYGNLSEESVKMVVLSYLLDLAGFYESPCRMVTEHGVKVTAEDEGIQIRGEIDVLALMDDFWIVVIESKGTRFDVMSALPQLLSYMLANPDKLGVTYGLLMNGREFAFVELEASRYSVSQTFSINKPVTDLPIVLQVLKQIRDRIVK
jgi:hypothetical protein